MRTITPKYGNSSRPRTIPNGEPITPHLELSEYPCYQQAWELIDQAFQFIREAYGNYPWLDEWYLYG
ncbi:hypothetical protein L5D93_03010 [Paenibacillus thiaminolyticus]|nr:hypothetical protein [Paenibacillus thiaminolyticus]